jgi:insulysin
LSLLKEKNLAHALTTSSYNPARSFGLFELKVELTEEGLEKTDDILELVFQVRIPPFPCIHSYVKCVICPPLAFQYIEMLKEAGPQRWVWEEQRECLQLNFRFQEKQDPYSFVSTLSENLDVSWINYFIMEMLLVLQFVLPLQQFPIEHSLVGDFLMTEYKPELISEFLHHLSPQNLRHVNFSCVCL